MDNISCEPAFLYLVLLLLGQLHLLPLFLHLRGGQLLLLLVGRQELLPQAAQLANHAHELALFLRQTVRGTYGVRGGRRGVKGEMIDL